MIEVLASQRSFFRGIDIVILDRERSGLTIGRLNFEPTPVGQYYEPTTDITIEAAQALMDSLWNCGVRPTEGSGSAGAMSATQNHLKDLQKILFPLLNKVVDLNISRE